MKYFVKIRLKARILELLMMKSLETILKSYTSKQVGLAGDQGSTYNVLIPLHDVVTRDSLRISRGRITRLQLRAVYAEQEVRGLHDFWVTNRLDILELRSPAEAITNTNQGLSFTEIEQIVAQRIASVYETKTRVAHDSRNHVKCKKDKVKKNDRNNMKWEGNHSGSSCQQQNKVHKVIGAHVVGPSNKKVYAGNLPHCNMCKLHHTRPCTV
nr:hypothetical protein [Tanacetum cinerariifolium]